MTSLCKNLLTPSFRNLFCVASRRKSDQNVDVQSSPDDFLTSPVFFKNHKNSTKLGFLELGTASRVSDLVGLFDF